MTVIVSQSLYPVQAVERAFWHGNRYHCISAKVTLGFDEHGRLSELLRQPAFDLDEVWRDRPMRSSLLRPGDLIPFKPRTDVLVVGTARPPGGKATAQWDASLNFKGREKRLRLFGPRVWRHSLLSGWILSAPAPTEGVALLYENAYGGVIGPAREQFEEGEFYPDNPFGCGFVGRSRPDTQVEHRAAQIEAWNGAITRFAKDVCVGGFGPIPGFFPTRAKRMGTYDAAWEKEHKPNIPLDMDMRFWNCAPDDQQADGYLRERDEVVLEGLTGGASLRLAMPPFTAMTVAHYQDKHNEAGQLRLDTVQIDLDRKQLSLRYHRIIAMDERMDRISVHCAPHKPLSAEVARG
jgi:hypothetical protein